MVILDVIVIFFLIMGIFVFAVPLFRIFSSINPRAEFSHGIKASSFGMVLILVFGLSYSVIIQPTKDEVVTKKINSIIENNKVLGTKGKGLGFGFKEYTVYIQETPKVKTLDEKQKKKEYPFFKAKVSPTLLSFDVDDVEEISEKEFQKNKKEIEK